MNPLDLRGPEFLAFYLLLVGLTCGILWGVRRTQESGSVPRLDVSDPFLLAFLRAGKAEMLRVALFSLIDRGLLLRVNDGAQLVLAEPKAPEKVRRPLERELLLQFSHARVPQSALTVSTPTLDGEAYRQTLEQLHLIPSAGQKALRVLLFGLGTLLLGGLALSKIVVALS